MKPKVACKTTVDISQVHSEGMEGLDLLVNWGVRTTVNVRCNAKKTLDETIEFQVVFAADTQSKVQEPTMEEEV